MAMLVVLLLPLQVGAPESTAAHPDDAFMRIASMHFKP
jgi:hypothetical protein